MPFNTRKQPKTSQNPTRKPTRLQNLYRKVTKSKTNMAISAAIFATVMTIVGLFVTGKGAPLSDWTNLRNVLTKTRPGKILANLLQKLIDLVCSLLGIGIYPGCIVEFKDKNKQVFGVGSLSKTGASPLPSDVMKGELFNQITGYDKYVVVEVDGDNLKLKCANDTITMKNLKKKTQAEKEFMITNAMICNVDDSNSDCNKPTEYALIPLELMKKTGKINKD